MLQIGKAGEYLVCADLILKGYVAFLSEQGLPYDVLLDNGKKLLKVQVKTTLMPRVVMQRAVETKAYIFNIKKHGSNNLKRYEIDEVDLFALVCLDTMKIGYLKTNDMPETINIRVDALRGQYYDEKGMADYKKVMELKGTATALKIGEIVGISNTTVGKMLKDDYKPYETGARYFSDLVREREWFDNL
jgi:hypothetical protein